MAEDINPNLAQLLGPWLEERGFKLNRNVGFTINNNDVTYTKDNFDVVVLDGVIMFQAVLDPTSPTFFEDLEKWLKT